jgi:hypothetical protein
LSQKLVLRVAARVPEDPVSFWLGRLDADTQKANRSQFNRWMKWLNRQPNWETVTPRDLIVRQLEYEDNYVILDLLQRYIKGLILRKGSGNSSAHEPKVSTGGARSIRCGRTHEPNVRGER